MSRHAKPTAPLTALPRPRLGNRRPAHASAAENPGVLHAETKLPHPAARFPHDNSRGGAQPRTKTPKSKLALDPRFLESAEAFRLFPLFQNCTPLPPSCPSCRRGESLPVFSALNPPASSLKPSPHNDLPQLCRPDPCVRMPGFSAGRPSHSERQRRPLGRCRPHLCLGEGGARRVHERTCAV